jgi:hypothetical protein
MILHCYFIWGSVSRLSLEVLLFVGISRGLGVHMKKRQFSLHMCDLGKREKTAVPLRFHVCRNS